MKKLKIWKSRMVDASDITVAVVSMETNLAASGFD